MHRGRKFEPLWRKFKKICARRFLENVYQETLADDTSSTRLRVVEDEAE